MEQVVAQVAQGVAQAQLAIDRQAAMTCDRIEREPALRQMGITATWYHMAEVEVTLRLSLSLVSEGAAAGPPTMRAYAALFNAGYQNRFHVDSGGTSMVRIKLVSVPPVRAGGA